MAIQPQRVVIVKPKNTIGENLGWIAGSIIGLFILALAAWLLGPIVFGDSYTLGYWQTLALVVFLRAVIPRTPATPADRV